MRDTYQCKSCLLGLAAPKTIVGGIRIGVTDTIHVSGIHEMAVRKSGKGEIAVLDISYRIRYAYCATMLAVISKKINLYFTHCLIYTSIT